MRSLLGSWRDAIAVWDVEGCDRSSLLPSCSSCLRGSLKKDVGELKECDLSFSVSSASLRFVKKDVWEFEGER